MGSDVSITLAVEGMKCQGCASTVKTTLSGLDGVAAVTVDLDAGTVTVAGNASIDAGSIVQALAQAGYRVLRI